MSSEMFRPRAILLDFYGTMVEEDYALMAYVCDEIVRVSPKNANPKEVNSYWSSLISRMYVESYGDGFISQNTLIIY